MQNGLFERELGDILPPSQIKRGEPLGLHTTFRVGGPADYFLAPDVSRVLDAVELCRRHEMPYMVIGNGSNLLVADAGFRGAAICLGRAASGIRIIDEDASGAALAVLAGTLLSEAAAFAAKRGLAGMEFAAGIPGSMGGAVLMNAGAYGGEIKDILESAAVLAKGGRILDMPAGQLDMSYRHSALMESGGIVLEARIRLERGDTDEIYARMEDYGRRRREKQPLEYPSAGSTFKRPPGHYAGRLIQDAGLAGFRIGDAQVSEKHAGFIINRGNATAADIAELIRLVTLRVEKNSGVVLEPEVRFIGF